MIALLLAVPASAVTHIVTTDLDVVNPFDGVLSLREALAASGTGDLVVFDTVVFPSGSKKPISLVLGSLVVPVDDLVVDGDDRVILDGSSAGAGTTGFEVAALRTQIRGFEIVDMPDYGIWVQIGVNHVIGATPGGGLVVRRSGLAGIRVGDAGAMQGTQVLGVVVEEACTNPSGGCAGIEVRSGGALSNVRVALSTVTGTQGDPLLSQGNGIFIGTGSGHEVDQNTVGGHLMGNGSHGILVSGSSAVTATLSDNHISSNGGSGIHLGPGSNACTVVGNRIGLDPSGSAAAPNGRSGVAVFGSDSHTIVDNVLSGNVASGLRLGGANGGNWQSDHVIQGNLVGTDVTGAAAVPNQEHGLFSDGLGGGSTIGGPEPGEGNLVSGNRHHGIRLEDSDHVVQGNRIGTDLGGTAAVPNGTGAGSWSGLVLHGSTNVRVGGSISLIAALPELGPMNQISGNDGDGVRLQGGAAFAEILGNLVGTSADGDTPLGNGGHGIVVGEASAVEVGTNAGRNVVLGNGGDGIHVGSDAGGTSAVDIVGNLVGRGVLGTVTGNLGAGIAVAEDGYVIVNGSMVENRVEGNGGVGVRLHGASAFELSRNVIAGNAQCAVAFTGGANGGIAAPSLSYHLPLSLTGTFPAPPVGVTVDRVEVFWDEDDEASQYLGDATLTGTAWDLQTTADRPFPVGGRISATVTQSDGNTSSLGAFCGDGCAPSGTGSCADGNPCTTDTCTVGGCTHTNNSATCSDGNPTRSGSIYLSQQPTPSRDFHRACS